MVSPFRIANKPPLSKSGACERGMRPGLCMLTGFAFPKSCVFVCPYLDSHTERNSIFINSRSRTLLSHQGQVNHLRPKLICAQIVARPSGPRFAIDVFEYAGIHSFINGG
jgi:hypothetical protein